MRAAKTWRSWRADEDAAVRSAWAAGAPAASVAAALGRSEDAVRCRARALGATRATERWSDADDRALELAWTSRDVGDLARDLGRTPSAVVQRARHLGIGGYTRGTKSLLAVARETGYDRERLERAARAIGLTLDRSAGRGGPARRLTARRNYALRPHHEAALLAFLARWPDGARLPDVGRRGRGRAARRSAREAIARGLA